MDAELNINENEIFSTFFLSAWLPNGCKIDGYFLCFVFIIHYSFIPVNKTSPENILRAIEWFIFF